MIETNVRYSNASQPAEAEGVERWSELRRLADAVPGKNWRAGNVYGKPFIPAYQVIADTPDGPCVVLEGNQNFIEQAEAAAAFAATACPTTILNLIAALSAVTAERDQLRAAINDPEIVFINMKAGTIARPTLRSMIDLYGEVVNGDEAQLLEIARLRADVEAMRQASAPHPFAQKIIKKLRRFEECAEDPGSGGTDIGRHWLDLLTQLGLLNRVQRSPAIWEITAQGEDVLVAMAAKEGDV
ncbi:hypothetical protein [Pseudomonas indica]|uniref:hypothetical protein n=1 Tax=Pseudomonas indica TaxID=137658 RepID=UPI003FD0A1EB